MSKGLVVVDTQNDFARPDGSLYVSGGEKVARGVHTLLTGTGSRDFKKRYATKDWHNPATNNGGHFHENPDFVDTWVKHCLAGSEGSDLAGPLDGYLFDDVFHKGWDEPAYSGFQAYSSRNMTTSLNGALQVYGIGEIYVCGIASTHCVLATVLEGLDLGYVVKVLSDLTVGVGGEENHRQALKEMESAGAIIL